MIRILFITHMFPSYKGQSKKEVSYAILYLALKLKKYSEIFVINPIPFYKIMQNKNTKPGFLAIEGTDSFIYPYFKIPKMDFTVFNIPKILEILKEKQFFPDVIVAELNDNFKPAFLLSKKLKTKLVLGIHQSDILKLKKEKNNKTFQIFFENSDKIACRSFAIYNKLKNIYPQFQNKMFIANFGIDENIIENKQFFLKKSQLFKNQDNIIFITVSSLKKLKNIDLNIKTLSKFNNKNWKYYIIGNGEEKSNLKKLVKKFNLENRVILKGYKEREEIFEDLKKSHVFVMVSAPETFGLAYLEAMAKANIIICSKGWGIDGIVIDGINGFLVEPRNEKELHKTFEKIFNLNQRSVEKILLNTWETINEYTLEKVTEKFFKNIFE